MPHNRSERSCGGCTACCYTHEVKDLEKPERTWCSDCKIGVGCKRYETRPSPCKTFMCRWRSGNGSESDRPDKNNCVVSRATIALLGDTLVVHELFLGAVERSPFVAAETQEAMRQRLPVWTKREHGRDSLYLPRSFEINLTLRLELMGRNVAVHRYHFPA